MKTDAKGKINRKLDRNYRQEIQIFKQIEDISIKLRNIWLCIKIYRLAFKCGKLLQYNTNCKNDLFAQKRRQFYDSASAFAAAIYGKFAIRSIMKNHAFKTVLV